MNNDKPKVSVIVPAYNVETYLGKCLDSIINQTLQEIEIICIDDGSTDSSGMILEEYANQDSRIKVIHKKNSGYGATMNVGIQHANGEYIGIVESDDCILPTMYACLYEEAKKQDLDMIKSEAFFWLASVNYTARIHYKSMNDYFNIVLTEVDRNKFFSFYMNVWTGIYKKSFLDEHHICFHESPGASFQDNGFWLQTCMYAKRAEWLDSAFYLYRQDNPIASVRSESKMMAMSKEYDYVEELLIDRKQYDLLSYCNSVRLKREHGTWFRIADERKREYIDILEKEYSLYKSTIRFNGFLDKWFVDIIKNPDQACDKVIRKKREIKEKIKMTDGIIIYGAGKVGDHVLRFIFNEEYQEKLKCFAESKPEDANKVGDIDLFAIEDAIKKYPNSLVILAVVKGTPAYDSMREKIKKIGVSDMIDGSDIEECFYILGV